MREKLIIIALCVLAVLVGAAWTLKPGAQQWEYKTEYLPSDKKLNELGSEGWELVAIAAKGINLGYVFKRQK